MFRTVIRLAGVVITFALAFAGSTALTGSGDAVRNVAQGEGPAASGF